MIVVIQCAARTMDSLGINWHDIQMGEMSAGIAAFLKELLTRRG